MKFVFSFLIYVIFISGLVAQEMHSEESEHEDNRMHEEANRWYSEIGFSFSHFEQQVKQEIGGTKGALLVDETIFSVGLSSGYKILKFLSAGVYLRYDSGTSQNGEFGGFDSAGKAVVVNNVGGDFSELWIGPFLRFHWKEIFLSAGYGLYGSRFDDGRGDLPLVTSGSTGSNDFTLDPSVAFVFNLGGNVEITHNLSAYFGIEYRARYYNQKNGNSLSDNIVLGTQNITPLIGLQSRF